TAPFPPSKVYFILHFVVLCFDGITTFFPALCSSFNSLISSTTPGMGFSLHLLSLPKSLTSWIIQVEVQFGHHILITHLQVGELSLQPKICKLLSLRTFGNAIYDEI
ncbi:uncharacterized protein EDB91DRAFT_1136978, partial [Suillus paluster]|uniref:uncharacterized protein n=1 Tax=Suillus paluster TaxID=48578 RepID=UPI001B86E03E